MMRLLPRLLGLGLLSLLFALVTMSCETTRRGTEEYVRPDRVKTVDGSPSADERPSEVASRQIAQLSETGQMEYKTSQSELARAFIRQFGDGTVIDKVMVRKAPGKGQEAAGYFLVGLGLRSGMFRAMAIPLQSGSDNTFSLSSAATRYIINGVGCNACTFNFEGTRIVGTTCADNSGGSRCDLRVEPTNSLFTRRPGAASGR